MRFLIFAIFLITLSQIIFVKSGVVLNKIKCGLHKATNHIHQHDHNNENPCEEVGSRNKIYPDENFVQSSSSKPEFATVPEGRRIISVGSNCDEGWRADSRGICREEY